MRSMDFIKVALLVMAVMLVAVFRPVSGSQAGNEKAMSIEGTITAISPDTGNVTVDSGSGSVTLTAPPEIDIQSFQVGDEVTVEHSSNGIITLIMKKD